MSTPAQQAKYTELKPMLEAKGWDVAPAPDCCQMLVTLQGPIYVQVYISTNGKIVILGDLHARWESMVSQEAVDFIQGLLA
jgi:hypothetical protein